MNDLSLTQLSFFDNPDDREHPLLVASKWGFDLQHYQRRETEGGNLYSVQDWIMGIGGIKQAAAKAAWNRIPTSTLGVLVQTLPYTTTNKRVYQMDYTDQQGCYIIAQEMRAMKDRPQLEEIQRYLANAGVFTDMARRNPEAAIVVLENVAANKRHKTIDRLKHAGYGEHAVTTQLEARDTNIANFQRLKKTIAAICENPRYGVIFNAEYQALLGFVAKELETMLNAKNVRDALPLMQLQALTLAETALQRVLERYDSMSNEQILHAVSITITPIGEYLRTVSEAAGIHHVTGKPLLHS
jgi:hypothetical protein